MRSSFISHHPYRIKKDHAIGGLLRYLESSSTVISHVSEIDPYNDEPKIVQCTTEHIPTRLSNSITLRANGADFDRDTAYIKAVMETIERWHISVSPKAEVFERTSYNNLQRQNRRALNPQLCDPLSHKQHTQGAYSSLFSTSEAEDYFWTEGKTGDNKQILLPAQLMYLYEPDAVGEKIIQFPVSTGAAAGFSPEEALYRGMCETVERDHLAIAYYNQLSLPKLDITQIKSELIQAIVQYITHYYYTVHMFKLDFGLGIPTFMCILENDRTEGIPFSIGSASDLSTEYALYKSLLEGIQGISILRDIHYLSREKEFVKSQMRHDHMLKRQLYWLKPENKTHLSFWLDQEPTAMLNEVDMKTTGDAQTKCARVLDILRSKKYDLYWKKIDDNVLSKFGIHIVKVIIPDLQPLCLVSDFDYWGGKRLEKYRVTKKGSESFFQIPHPFP